MREAVELPMLIRVALVVNQAAVAVVLVERVQMLTH
jgi:hypothetical protein